MGGGAWPFLVGGVICQVNSVNERDFIFLVILWFAVLKLEEHHVFNMRKHKAITGL